MTARVKVTADSIEEAQQIAQRPAFFNDPEVQAKFELDEGNVTSEVYLPDSEDYEEVAASPKR
jgi:hypothetical protein